MAAEAEAVSKPSNDTKSCANTLVDDCTQDGNVIGGDFRLGFDGYTTAVIAYDASASELGLALTDLPSIDSVDVS